MRSTSSRLSLIFMAVAFLVAALPARAQLSLQADDLRLSAAHLQGFAAGLQAQADGIALELTSSRTDWPALGWRKVALRLQGLFRLDESRRWRFDGHLQLRGAPGGAASDAALALVVDPAANTLQLTLSQGKGQLSGAIPLDQPSHLQVALDDVPAGWLQGVLNNLWAGRLGSGRVSANLALDLGEQSLQGSGQFNISGLAFDTPDGALAAQNLGGTGRLGVSSSAGGSQVALDGSLRGGDLLLGPLFARLPSHPVQVAVDAHSGGGALELKRLRIGDADALQLDGALAFDAKARLKSLRLDRLQARFPAAYQRYGQAWLDTLGLKGLSVAGSLDGSLDWNDAGLHRFAFDTDGLDLSDGAGRLALEGLRGGLSWSEQGQRPPTSLAWRRLSLYRIPYGAAQSHWQSDDGSLALQQPLNLPVLGGNLRVGNFTWRPAAAKGQRLQTSLVVTGVDMSAFSKALGWPAFPGTLAGAIPSLRWVDDRFELAGGLSLNVFDGFVDVTALALQQPFGTHPAMSADISLRQLDLGALTSVFDFGSITGRLDGSINQLRLVDWVPVGFQASLRANGGGKISQRAVNNLTSVGGGGIAGGLQGAMLRLFKTFGYRRIGLSCTLAGSVCHMGGLDQGKDGYTIVEGSGLPRLRVVGHQNEVDWPTLVNRLKAATEGGGPEIR